eukprot:scaffold113553_cov75-Phaeocystis_antarctica.AAC.1
MATPTLLHHLHHLRLRRRHRRRRRLRCRLLGRALMPAQIHGAIPAAPGLRRRRAVAVRDERRVGEGLERGLVVEHALLRLPLLRAHLRHQRVELRLGRERLAPGARAPGARTHRWCLCGGEECRQHGRAVFGATRRFLPLAADGPHHLRELGRLPLLDDKRLLGHLIKGARLATVDALHVPGGHVQPRVGLTPRQHSRLPGAPRRGLRRRARKVPREVGSRCKLRV